MIDAVEVARRVIDANSFMTLATADAAGEPWASPVWFAHLDHRQLLWISRPTRRHSQNVAVRPRVAVVIFDSTCVPGEGEAVFATGAAVESVDPAHVAAYSARCRTQGLPDLTLDSVTGDGPFRLYHLATDAIWVLDEHEDRIAVDL